MKCCHSRDDETPRPACNNSQPTMLLPLGIMGESIEGNPWTSLYHISVMFEGLRGPSIGRPWYQEMPVSRTAAHAWSPWFFLMKLPNILYSFAVRKILHMRTLVIEGVFNPVILKRIASVLSMSIFRDRMCQITRIARICLNMPIFGQDFSHRCLG